MTGTFAIGKMKHCSDAQAAGLLAMPSSALKTVILRYGLSNAVTLMVKH